MTRWRGFIPALSRSRRELTEGWRGRSRRSLATAMNVFQAPEQSNAHGVTRVSWGGVCRGRV